MADDDTPDRGSDGNQNDDSTDSLAGRLRNGTQADTGALLTYGLAVVFVIALAGVIYVGLTPQQATDPYTEFYILGPDGNASNYPVNLSPGEEARVIAGVGNRERDDLTYTLTVKADGQTLTTRTLSVGNGQTLEERIRYTISEEGEVMIRFLLYKGEDPSGEPYRTLQLLINVTRR